MLLHVGAWIAQFIGHYYFEKNSPAFTDSLVQSFLIAPMFVLIDIQYLLKQRMSN